MRIAVAEDALLMRQGIVAVLASGGHKIIWEASAADRILPACAGAPPDVLVTDVRMPPGEGDDGLRAALLVRARFPSVGILVLSQYPGNEYARQLLHGASNAVSGTGYLLKENVGRVLQFLTTVDTIGSGGVSIDPKVVTQLLSQPEQSPLSGLSERQLQVLELVAQGRTNTQIARELHVSSATLERTISRLFMALGISEDDGNRRVLAVLERLKA